MSQGSMIAFGLLAGVFITGCCYVFGVNCPPPPPPIACQVTPLDTSKASADSAQKLNVDLASFTKVPVTVSVENSVKSSLDFTLAKVPERKFACAMILQSIQCCIKEKANDLANKMWAYVEGKGMCVDDFNAFRASMAVH